MANEDSIVIGTKIGKLVLKKFLEAKIRKKLARSIDIRIKDLYIQHRENEEILAEISLLATMSESELSALINQLMGG